MQFTLPLRYVAAATRQALRPFCVLLAVTVAPLLPSILQAQTTTPIKQSSTSGPSLTGVNDVLDGRLTLLEQTDAGILIGTAANGSDPINLQGSLIPFYSNNSNLIGQAPVNLAYQTGGSFGRQDLVYTSASGRVFNNGNDVIFSTGITNSCATTNYTFLYGWSYTYYNPVTGSNQTYCLPHDIYPNGDRNFTKVVMGNFQGNNLVEPLVFLQSQFNVTNNTPQYVLSQLNIITVPDVNKTDQINTTGGQVPWAHDSAPNVSYGVAGCPNAPYPLANTIVVGDLNGDGIDEIAVLLSDYKTVGLFKVSATNLTPTLYSCISLPEAVPQGTLAAGRFGTTGNVYLAAVGHTADGNSESKSITIEFINTSTSPATIVTTKHDVTNPYYHPNFGPVYAKAAPIANWNSTTAEQLVIASSYYYDSWIVLDVGSFSDAADSSYSKDHFNIQSENGYTGCLFGMEVGNFNHQNASAASTSNTTDPSLQIGLLQSTNGTSQCVPPFANGSLHLLVQNVTLPNAVTQDPLSPNPPASANYFFQASDTVPDIGNYNIAESIQLLTGDFQGRSLRLGAPEKVVIKGHLRPNFILGIPPMHVDWVNPSFLNTAQTNYCEPNTQTGDKKQCILNLTTLPYPTSGGVNTAFNSYYAVSETSQSSSGHKSTTSWGISNKFELDSEVSYGQKDVATVSAGIKIYAQNAFQHVHDTYSGQYQKASQSLSFATGFDDVLYFTDETQNIFSYPILGQSDAQGNPLYVLYSVPSETTVSLLDGSTQQWYQPVHEIGNVLSYPSSVAFLKDEVSSGSLDDQAKTTCTSPGSFRGVSRIGWNSGNKGTTSIGWNDSFSAGVTLSGSANVTPTILTEGVGVKEKGSVSASGSGGWGGLDDSYTDMSLNQAVVITSPQFNKTLSDTTGYAYQGFVFGTFPATPAYEKPQDILPKGLDLSTSGPLYTGFIANPFSGGSGIQCGQSGNLWWTTVYNKPDVGFNHPERWDVSNANVVTFNSAQAGVSPRDQAFYHMKGLYITNYSTSGDAPISTVSSVNATQKIILSARVYNFSPVATNAVNPSSTVHVRFYGQRLVQIVDPKTNNIIQVLDPQGAFPIRGNGNADGDVILKSITGFGQSTPNWAFATTVFDTTNYDNTELVFWVVTWMEDGNGNTLSEMPDHGVLLQSFAGKTFKQITDIPLQAHSNNVGLFGANTPFYVAPAPDDSPSSAAISLVDTSTKARNQTSLKDIRLDVSRRLTLDKKVPFHAIFTAATEFPGSQVRYFDGDPDNGGRLIDLQTVHQLQAGETAVETGYFRPTSCGVHTLYAVANVDGEPAVMGKGGTKVTLDPLAEVDAMSFALSHSVLPSATEVSLQQTLSLARARFAANSTEPALESLSHFEHLLAPSVADTGEPGAVISEQLQARSSILRSCVKALYPHLSSVSAVQTFSPHPDKLVSAFVDSTAH